MSAGAGAGISPGEIRATVENLVEQVDEADEIRQDLKARGVPLTTIRLLVSLHSQGDEAALSDLLDASVAAVRQEQGGDLIDRDSLAQQIDTIAALETGLDDARRQAREQGLDPQSLFFLVNLIQRHPGDGGSKAINDFLGYASACGIAVTGGSTPPPEAAAGEAAPVSVLPDVTRRPHGARGEQLRSLACDAALGLCIGLGVIALLV